jgi:hypothetical protein
MCDIFCIRCRRLHRYSGRQRERGERNAFCFRVENSYGREGRTGRTAETFRNERLIWRHSFFFLFEFPFLYAFLNGRQSKSITTSLLEECM